MRKFKHKLVKKVKYKWVKKEGIKKEKVKKESEPSLAICYKVIPPKLSSDEKLLLPNYIFGTGHGPFLVPPEIVSLMEAKSIKQTWVESDHLLTRISRDSTIEIPKRIEKMFSQKYPLLDLAVAQTAEEHKIDIFQLDDHKSLKGFLAPITSINDDVNAIIEEALHFQSVMFPHTYQPILDNMLQFCVSRLGDRFSLEKNVLLQLYKEQDLTRLKEIFKTVDEIAEDSARELLSRHKHWEDTIITELAKGGSLICAGISHFILNEKLFDCLYRLGYQIEPLPVTIDLNPVFEEIEVKSLVDNYAEKAVSLERLLELGIGYLVSGYHRKSLTIAQKSLLELYLQVTIKKLFNLTGLYSEASEINNEVIAMSGFSAMRASEYSLIELHKLAREEKLINYIGEYFKSSSTDDLLLIENQRALAFVITLLFPEIAKNLTLDFIKSKNYIAAKLFLYCGVNIPLSTFSDKIDNEFIEKNRQICEQKIIQEQKLTDLLSDQSSSSLISWANLHIIEDEGLKEKITNLVSAAWKNDIWFLEDLDEKLFMHFSKNPISEKEFIDLFTMLEINIETRDRIPSIENCDERTNLKYKLFLILQKIFILQAKLPNASYRLQTAFILLLVLQIEKRSEESKKTMGKIFKEENKLSLVENKLNALLRVYGFSDKVINISKETYVSLSEKAGKLKKYTSLDSKIESNNNVLFKFATDISDQVEYLGKLSHQTWGLFLTPAIMASFAKAIKEIFVSYYNKLATTPEFKRVLLDLISECQKKGVLPPEFLGQAFFRPFTIFAYTDGSKFKLKPTSFADDDIVKAPLASPMRRGSF